MLELRNGENVIGIISPGAQFTLPNGDVVSPAYAGWSNKDYSLVAKAPVVPVTPSPQEVLAMRRQQMVLTFAQLLIGLVTEGWITDVEGRAWLKGDPPDAVNQLIESLPQPQRFAAYARAVAPSVVERLDPLVVALGQLTYKSEEEIDLFFETYSVV